MGKIKLADIADKAGVSVVTVHNALLGHRGVSEEVRKKIQDIADELNYEWHNTRHFIGKCTRSLPLWLQKRTALLLWKF